MAEQVNQNEESEFQEKVVYINRVAKVVKGGRRFSFSALVVTGDRNGSVGIGLGKANEVPAAIKKASKNARASMVQVSLKGSTIPHEVVGKYGAGQVWMKPAFEGTGVIASAPVRAVLEAAGVQNILTKSQRSNNPHNVLKATLQGLKDLRNEADFAKRRGKEVAEV